MLTNKEMTDAEILDVLKHDAMCEFDQWVIELIYRKDVEISSLKDTIKKIKKYIITKEATKEFQAMINKKDAKIKELKRTTHFLAATNEALPEIVRTKAYKDFAVDFLKAAEEINTDANSGSEDCWFKISKSDFIQLLKARLGEDK